MCRRRLDDGDSFISRIRSGSPKKEERSYDLSSFLCIKERTRTIKYNSPVFAKDGIIEWMYIAYLPPTCRDFPQCSSIFPDNHYRYELYDHKKPFCQTGNPAFLDTVPFINLTTVDFVGAIIDRPLTSALICSSK